MGNTVTGFTDRVWFLSSWLILFFIVGLPWTTHSNIIHVPDDYPTIAGAVLFAEDWDTISVAEGVYEGLYYIAGVESPRYVTLMGSGWHYGTVITGVPGVYEGFYLMHADGWRITNFEITQSRIGVRVDSLKSCVIDHNYIHGQYGSGYPYPFGIIGRFDTQNLRIHHNLITDINYGGILIRYNNHNGVHIYNNTIEDIHWYEGIQFCEVDFLNASVVTNNIITNCGGQGVEFAYCSQGNTEVSYNCIFETNGPWQNVPNPGPGNIFVSPQFLLEPTIPEYYYLSENSPCIDTGNPDPYYNDPNGTRSDMGAFPYGYALVELQIEWVSAFPGDTVDVPITISDVSNLEVINIEFTIAYPYEDLEFLYLTIPPNSLPQQAGWSLNYSGSSGLIDATLEGQTPLNGSGLLAVMTYVLDENVFPDSIWHISFDRACLNHGALETTTVDGGIRIPSNLLFGDVSLNGQVTMQDASLLFDYLVEEVNFNSLQLHLGEVSGQSGLTAYDGALITQFCFEQFPLFPVEGGNVAMYAEGDLYISEITAYAGEELELPVYIEDGVNVASIECEMFLENEYVELIEIAGPGHDVWFSRYTGEYPHYELYLGGNEPLNGDQVLFYITFHIPDTASGSFMIRLDGIMLNETEIAGQVTREIDIQPTGVNNQGSEIPHEFAFRPAYPNPFNPVTTLVFSIPTMSQVRLTIYNSLGQVVEIIESGMLPAGRYSRMWNATEYSSGVYIAELITGNNRQCRKLMLVK